MTTNNDNWDWRSDPDANKGGGGLLLKGKYIVRAVRTEIGVSTLKRTPFVEVTFDVLADADRAPCGGKVKSTFYLSPNAKPRFRNLLAAIDAPAFNPFDAESTGMAILGRTLWAEVVVKPYTLKTGEHAGQTRDGNEIEFGMFALHIDDKAEFGDIPAASYFGADAGGPPPLEDGDPGPDLPF